MSLPHHLDLGDGHRLVFFCWDPDPELNAWAADLPGDPGEFVGANVYHRGPDGSDCAGGVHFDTPRGRALAERSHGRATWTVESWEPLTLSPSLLCRAAVYDSDGRPIPGRQCGDHGFVRGGRWEKA